MLWWYLNNGPKFHAVLSFSGQRGPYSYDYLEILRCSSVPTAWIATGLLRENRLLLNRGSLNHLLIILLINALLAVIRRHYIATLHPLLEHLLYIMLLLALETIIILNLLLHSVVYHLRWILATRCLWYLLHLLACKGFPKEFVIRQRLIHLSLLLL